MTRANQKDLMISESDLQRLGMIGNKINQGQKQYKNKLDMIYDIKELLYELIENMDQINVSLYINKMQFISPSHPVSSLNVTPDISVQEKLKQIFRQNSPGN